MRTLRRARRLLVTSFLTLSVCGAMAQTTITADTSYASGTTTIDEDVLVTNGATVTVSGTATFSTNAHDLYLGENSSAGSLAITSGGTVLIQGGILGQNAPDTGTLTVDGSGALFVATGGLHIGVMGTGTATVVNGGAISVSGSGGTAAPALGAGTGTVAIGNASTLNVGAASAATAAAAGIINGSIAAEDADYSGTLQFNTTGTSAAPTYFTKNGISTGTGVNVASVALVHTAGYTVFTGTLEPGSTTINGGTLQIGNGGTTGSITGDTTDNGTLAFSRSNAMTYSGTISGTGGVTKSGTGMLTLSGSNTYTGTTTLSAGTLSLGSADAIGPSGTILFSGGTLQFSAANTTDYSARFSTAPNQQYRFDPNGKSVTVGSDLTSSGGSLFKTGTGTLILSGANTYSGATTVTGSGILRASGNAQALGAGTLVLNNSSLKLQLAGDTDLNFGRNTTVSASATIVADRVTTGPGTTHALGTVTIASAATSLALEKGSLVTSGTAGLTFDAVVLTGGVGSIGLSLASGTLLTVGTVTGSNRNYNISGSGDMVINGAIANGTGRLSNNSTGVLTLNATDSPFTGSVVLQAGTTKVMSLADRGSASSLGAGTDAISLGNSNSSSRLIYASATDSSSNRGFTLFANGATQTLEVAGAGTLTLSGNLSGVSGFGVAPTTLQLNGANTGANTISGIIGDGATHIVSLTKSGTGTWILSGANTYTGTTAINAGKLVMNGSLAAASVVTVNSGGTLSGSGMINGTLTIASGGILSPGNSPGTLTAGATTFAGGGAFTWELNQASGAAGVGPGWDLLSVDGALDLSATSGSPFTIHLTSLTLGNAAGSVGDFDAAANYSFVFAATTAGIIGFDADAFTLDTNAFQNPFGGTWSVGLANGGHDLALSYTAASAIPEPSTYAISAGSALFVLVAWRRRRRAHFHAKRRGTPGE